MYRASVKSASVPTRTTDSARSTGARGHPGRMSLPSAGPAAAPSSPAVGREAPPGQGSSGMEWAVLRAADPREYMQTFVDRNIRPDGREFFHRREVSVQKGSIQTANGSCLARVGATTVLAAAKLEVSTPLNAAPRNGFLEISVQLTPLCSPRFKVGRPSDEALALQQHLQRVVLGGSILDLEQLCISEGKAVWNLKLDVLCLNHDGAAADAALLAVVGALADLRIPATVVTKVGDGNGDRGGRSLGGRASRDAPGGSGVLVETLPDESSSAVVLGGIPLSISFGVFSGNVLVDPNAEEEAILDCVFTLVVGIDGASSDSMRLYSVYKPGGIPLGTDVIDQALDRAFELVQGDEGKIMKLSKETY